MTIRPAADAPITSAVFFDQPTVPSMSQAVASASSKSNRSIRSLSGVVLGDPSGSA